MDGTHHGREGRGPGAALRGTVVRGAGWVALGGLASACIIINNYPPDPSAETEVATSASGSTGGTAPETGLGPETGVGTEPATTSGAPSTGSSSGPGPETGSSSGITTSGGGSTSTSTSSETQTDTDTDTDTEATGGPPTCGNGVVEAPELCFQPAVIVGGGPGQRPSGLVFADFDDDGMADLAEGSLRTVNLSTASRINILLGDPVLGLDLAVAHLLGDPSLHGGVEPGCMDGADFDGDGRVDLAFIQQHQFGVGFQPHLVVWLSQGDTTFVSAFDQAFDPYVSVDSVAGEFTGDGLADVITYDGAGLHLWVGTGGGMLDPPLPPIPIAASSVSVREYDGDGIDDLFVSGGGVRTIQLGQPGGSFVEVAVPACAGSVYSGVDFDGDGVLDLLCRDGDTLDTRLGQGDGTFGGPVSMVFPPGTLPNTPFSAGDFDGDGEIDFAWHVSGGGVATDVFVIRGQGGGMFGMPELLLSDMGGGDHWPQGTVARDVNGDGISDLMVIHATIINTYLLRMFLSAP